MSDEKPVFELARDIERYVAMLSKVYETEKKELLQKIIVNSDYKIHEEWSSDTDWNITTTGHALYLYVPEAIYPSLISQKDVIENQIKDDLNKVHNVKNEFIERIFLEMQIADAHNWRKESGLLLNSKRVILPDIVSQIWRNEKYCRVFLSHKAEYSQTATEFKDTMDYYGVSCFVAHKDIEPTKEWQEEIEKALFSMHLLVALMTENFSESRWTDQEIGIAIGREVPVIPVRLGMDPYGFIGKYQGLSGTNRDVTTLAREVYDLLWTKPAFKPQLIESLVTRFEASNNYKQAIDLMNYLEKIENATPEIIERLSEAPKKNSQVKDASQVKTRLPRLLERLKGGFND